MIEDGAEKALLENVPVFFAKRTIAKCSALASPSKSDVESAEGWPTDLETKLFLWRCHQTAARASVVKAQTPSMAPSTSESGGLSSQVIQDMAQHIFIVGNQISAQAIMAIMAGTAPQGVKPAELLANANLVRQERQFLLVSRASTWISR